MDRNRDHSPPRPSDETFSIHDPSHPASLTTSQSPTPVPTHHHHSQSHHSQPPQAHQNPRLQAFIQAATPLRHLASHSSLNSTFSNSTTASHPGQNQPSSPTFLPSPTRSRFRPISTTFADQRYGGKHVSITRSTRPWTPQTIKEDVDSAVQAGEGVGRGSLRSSARESDATTLRVGGESRGSAGEYSVGKDPEIQAKHDGGSETVEEKGVDDGGGRIGAETVDDDETVYPGPLGLFVLITGIALSVFLISLDRTIITTAIPFITSQFNSPSDVGWYGSAYLLTASSFQPLYGRIYTLFNTKWSYLISLSLFELGSLICGIAPNSLTLIIGRAIAGLGSAGILTGSFVVVSYAVPLKQRPVLTAVVGLMFGVGATAGPLLGGVFTDLVTWRWCFYFNLPVGGATAVAMLFFFHPQNSHAYQGRSILYRVLELDIVGNILLLAASVMLFLALQYTEQQISWSSARVIGLLTGSGVTWILFGVWQWWKADGALMPPRILSQRTVAASCGAAFFIYSAILIQSYYLPMWFQAIKGDSAISSGVNMIPYVVANAIFSLLAGIFVSKNGYFVAPAVVGMVIGTAGSGMFLLFDENTSTGYWMGAEILASAGIGMAIQQGFTAVQIVLPLDEVAIGTAAVVAFQSLGGAIFVSIGNTILQNTLLNANLPGIDIQAVIDDGAGEFRRKVSAEQLPALLKVYNSALTKVFTAAIPMAGLAIFACACMEWRNVKDSKKKDLENEQKAHDKRIATEKAILEKHRRTLSATTTQYGSDGYS